MVVPTMASHDVTLETFEETVTKDGIVLLDFWASWCGPCRICLLYTSDAADE